MKGQYRILQKQFYDNSVISAVISGGIELTVLIKAIAHMLRVKLESCAFVFETSDQLN